MNARWVVASWLSVGILLGTAGPGLAAGDDAWLDEPMVSWNQAGMPVPPAVRGEATFGLNDPFCERSIRPPESLADLAVVDAGWALVGSYEGGWGLIAVTATVGFDGMCRPMGYQIFVFADGVFAGTVSPGPMASRTSGAGSLSRVTSGALFATFVRYADVDALCCPSRPSVLVEYRIEPTDEGPVLVPSRVFA